MLKYNYKESLESHFIVKEGLNELLKRLKKGMQVKGRIIDCLGQNKYLLRIWGYNILTESKQSFQKFDEIQLTVREVKPNLILDFVREKQDYNEKVGKNEERTNILIY